MMMYAGHTLNMFNFKGGPQEFRKLKNIKDILELQINCNVPNKIYLLKL